MCRLTWAQAAICHPVLASLILILSPAWPSRPAVSSPQKGFLLGGVWRGDKGREELWQPGSSTSRPPDLGPGPAGQTAETDSIVSAPCRHLLLFYQLHRPQGLTGSRRRGRRQRQRQRGGEGAGQINTMKRLIQTSLTPSPLHSSQGTGLPIPYGQADALSSLSPVRPLPSPPLPPSPPPTACGQERPYWP